jgi:hypothetical protein
MYSQEIVWGVDWYEQGQVEDSCKHGNKLRGSIKCVEFLD